MNHAFAQSSCSTPYRFRVHRHTRCNADPSILSAAAVWSHHCAHHPGCSWQIRGPNWLRITNMHQITNRNYRCGRVVGHLPNVANAQGNSPASLQRNIESHKNWVLKKWLPKRQAPRKPHSMHQLPRKSHNTFHDRTSNKEHTSVFAEKPEHTVSCARECLIQQKSMSAFRQVLTRQAL